MTNSVDGDHQPSWSPDGSKVAFSRQTECVEVALPDCTQIWVIASDGTGERRLTTTAARSEEADWSPDGEKIVFVRYVPLPDDDERIIETDIYVVSAEGTGERRLTSGAGLDESPEWSPDGQQIVFVSERRGNYDIHIIDADGSNQRPLTRTPDTEVFASWSPDGRMIAFERRSENGQEIFVMNADGSAERRLTPRAAPDGGEAYEGEPSWSPDGEQIVFGHLLSEIWIMNADGSGRRNLTNGKFGEASNPDWAAAKG